MVRVFSLDSTRERTGISAATNVPLLKPKMTSGYTAKVGLLGACRDPLRTLHSRSISWSLLMILIGPRSKPTNVPAHPGFCGVSSRLACLALHKLVGNLILKNLSLPLLLALAIRPLRAEQLKPETVRAFDHYVEISEQRMSNELRSGRFLRVD